jgi:hypothetical protein
MLDKEAEKVECPVKVGGTLGGTGDGRSAWNVNFLMEEIHGKI